MPWLGLTTTPNDSLSNLDDAATMQALYGALALVKGEWVFDQDEGFPLFTDVLTKAPDLDRIRALVRRQLLSVRPGLDVLLNDEGDLAIVNGDLVFGTVKPIVDVDVTVEFSEEQRSLSISFVAYTAEGQALRDVFNVEG
jgi:hypothetical protein